MNLRSHLRGDAQNVSLSHLEINRLIQQVYARGDHVMLYILSIHAMAAVYLGCWSNTLGTAICVASVALGAFLASILWLRRPRSVCVVSGLTLQIFVPLFIHQLHGRPEVYLYQCIPPVLLVLYEDWLAILPCAVITIVGPLSQIVLQGQKSDLLAFTTVFHFGKQSLSIGLVLLQAAVCSCWAIVQRRRRLFWERQRVAFQASNACLQEALISSQASERELAEQAKLFKEAHEKAEDATETQRAFLANMSHEIRTPMNGVLGMASMLLCSPLTSEQREYAETIRSSSEALLTLLNDILDLAKIQQGHMTFEPLPTDIRKLAEDVIVLLFPKAWEKHLEIVLRVASDTPTMVMVDGMRVRQVLLNLLSNAIKFTNAGHVFLEIAPVGSYTDRIPLRFSITDTGIGIPQEKLSSIFERFTQADSSTTRRFGGTGLGLAIAKSLIELLEGQITAKSNVGTGSCFEFSLPLALPGPVEAPTKPLTGKRICVACPLSLTSLALKDTLESWGASVELKRSITTDGGPNHDSSCVDAIIAYSAAFQTKAAFATYCRERLDDNVPIVGVFSNEEDLGGLARTHVAASLLLPLRSASLLETLRQVLFQGPVSSSDTRSRWDAENEFLSLAGTRILVAEDNPVNRRVITAMLDKLGCKPDLATTGLEVIRMWESGTYDLILMDCQMPEMDGYEAAATIRRKERASGVTGTPIVALTANSMSGDREKCLLAGMDDHLPKPISLDALRRAVEHSVCAAQEVFNP